METDLDAYFDEFTRRDWQTLDPDAVDEPVRLALVGLGWFTRAWALPGIQRSAFTDATVVTDVDADAVDALADEHGLTGLSPTEFRDGVAADEYDAVYIATPNATHLDYVETAAEQGKAVLCEKPLATTVSAGREMVATCEDAGIELLVNHSRRFSYAYEALADLLHSEQLLGEVRSVRLTGGPEFLNLGTHYLDLLLYLLDTTIADARGGCVDVVDVNGTTRYAGGGTLTMADGTTVFIDPFDDAAKRLSIEGTAGRISAPISIAEEADQQWYYWDTADGAQQLTSPPEPLEELWQDDIAGTPETVGTDVVPAQSLFSNAAGHIADLAAGTRENAAPGSRAVSGLAGLVALVLSAETGSRISLPLSESFAAVPLSGDRTPPAD
jgi:xylose dehydrogenase (NAD/NADP)